MTSPLAAGTIVARRFAIERTTGQGGMGTIYCARDLVLEKLVALKLLHREVTQAYERERFTREAEILAELRHPGIVAYVAHGHTEEGQPFLAMDWLEGEDLAERLARQRLTVTESLTLVRCAAEALSTAHQRGVIHRDLKPSNLFLRDRVASSVTLLDFGIARQAHRTSLQTLTKTGAIVGTPAYMAPEQARGEGSITPSADVFSLGCVLFECLTSPARPRSTPITSSRSS
jgi:eukaryotic-like serine/threonine-protein kinase